MANFPQPISTLAGVLLKRNISPSECVKIDLSVCPQAVAEQELGDPIKGNVDFCERLPYHDTHGQPLEFARFRINYKDAGTYKDAKGKIQSWPKYKQAYGGAQRLFVYLPRLEGLDWHEIASDAKCPVVITEGEYKSITACKAGLITMGLGGVWNFGKSQPTFPPPIEDFDWFGRQVYICFDADNDSTAEFPLKVQVQRAATSLAEKLYRASAKPVYLNIARTPTFLKARALDPTAKMGLDDFLTAGGTVEELFKEQTTPTHNEDLALLNSKYAVCVGAAGNGVMDLDVGKMIRQRAFEEAEYHRYIEVPTASGGAKTVQVTQMFLKQRDRPTIRRVLFEPAVMPGFDRSQEVYNQWTGWPELRLDGEPPNGKLRVELVGVWRHLIEKLFGDHADYFETWCAHLIQKPGEKTSIGVMLVSVLNGVGKSLLGEILRGMVGDSHSKSVQLDRLKSNFNSIIERCLFLQMDEANGLQDGLETRLNDLITSDTVVVEHKGFDPIVVSNYMRLYLTSNSMRPIRLNKENRRWLVVNAGVVSGELKEWSEWCGTQAKRLRSSEGLWILRNHLEGIDLSEWDPTARVAITADMEYMVESSRTQNSVRVDQLLERMAEDWEAGKPWVVTGVLNSVSNKVWDDVKAEIRARGGQTLGHTFKVAGKTTKGVVLDPSGVLPRRIDASGTSKKWVLDVKGDLSKWDSDWAAGVARAARAWTETDDLVQRTNNGKY